MKLTDEEIENMKNSAFGYANPAARTYFAPFIENGILRAREFYENQKCETCENHLGCDIEDCMNDNEIEKPGCNQWEPKK